MRRRFAIFVAASLMFSVGARANGDLSATEARKLIAHMTGVELKTSAVRILKISEINAGAFEATAEIQTAFRFEQNEQRHWRVAEIRTGWNQWEQLDFITRGTELRAVVTGSNKYAASNLNQATKPESRGPCDSPDLAPRVVTSYPTLKRARCVIAALLGVQLPSDAVRIKSVEPSLLPLGSHPSALVETTIAADFRFTRAQRGSWQVSAVKSGSRDWINLDTLLSAANTAKAVTARADMESIAKALEQFRAKSGFYVDSKSEGVLIDFLNPLYLPHVIRLDPWSRPYRYVGTRDHFKLFSVGADGKENTASPS